MNLHHILLWLCTVCSVVGAETQQIELSPGAPVREAFGTTIFGIGEREANGVWPCNQWSNFSTAGFTADLANLKLEGGNAAIVLFPFVDGTEMPAIAEERQRQLATILEQADNIGIRITLRLGYAWDPGFASDSKHRQVGLLVEPDLRQRWYQFCAETYATVAKHPSFAGAFICWEDFWAFLGAAEAAEEGRKAWARYIGYRGETVPARRSPQMEDYYDYFNQVLTRDFFPATQQRFPGLGMEVRLDFDPIYDGDRFLKYYVHRQQFDAPNLHKVYLYWGPFMGALNQGDEINADTAVHLLVTALERAQSLSAPEADLIISQFNYRDNTPGFSSNTRISPGQVAEFVRKSAPILHQYCTEVYTWSNHSYTHNAINNGTFSTGPTFWTLAHSLVGLVDGQPCASIYPGGSVAQVIQPNSVACAGLDSSPTVMFTFRARAATSTTCSVGLADATHTIDLPGDGQWHRYTLNLERAGGADNMLRVTSSGRIMIDDLGLSNHTQLMGSEDPFFARDLSYADLANAMTQANEPVPTPVSLSGVMPDGWISSHATFATPTHGGRYQLTVSLTIPETLVGQTVTIKLRDSASPAVSRRLAPGLNRLVISGQSPLPTARLTLAFGKRQAPGAPDVRELAAHLDELSNEHIP